MNLPANPREVVVGFIGLGLMGAPVAGHLLKAGYRLRVYARNRDQSSDLIAAGAQSCDTVAQLAEAAQVIITMVSGPEDVRALYLGEGGIVRNARAGTYLVDMTTSTPTLAKKIHQAAAARGLYALDAPVSGGLPGALQGRLTVMVGGEAVVFEALRPVLEPVAGSVERFGSAGAGQTTKMCNQVAVAGTLIGMAEALACAKASGLNPQSVLAALQRSTAASHLLDRLGPKMLSGDREASFFVRHFIKDLNIAVDESRALGLEMPGAELVRDAYAALAGDGYQGIQSLIDAYPGQRSQDSDR